MEQLIITTSQQQAVATDTNGCEVEAAVNDIIAGSPELAALSNLKTVVYPNPFNSITTFLLTATTNADKISLEIFNVSGERIAMLFEEKLDQGEYRLVELNASDMAGDVYFYHITCGAEVMNGKLVLIK